MNSYRKNFANDDISIIPDKLNLAGNRSSTASDVSWDRRPVEFNNEIAALLKLEFFDSRHRNQEILYNRSIFRSFAPNVVFQIKSLYCSIQAYIDSGCKLMSAGEILLRTCDGPDYALYLKRLKTKSYITSTKAILYDYPDWWDSLPEYEINDIGEIFNYAYCFHWKETSDDYLFGKIPVKINPKTLDRFQNTLKGILPDEISEVKKEEFFLSLSSSVGLDSKFKKVKVWEEKGKWDGDNFFSHGPLIGRRSVIQVGPQNTRDSVILPISQSNTIRWIDAQAWQICENLRGSAMVKDLERFKHILEKFREDNLYFICRDIKKEGITKPRVLLQKTMEVLVEKYPHIEAFRYMDIYNDFTLILEDGSYVETDRGHGLGMANALTTIIQVAVFELIVQLGFYKQLLFEEINALVYNDDIAIGFTNQTDMENYWEFEDKIFGDLGLIRVPTKSFFSRHFVLCEEYSSRLLNRKDSYKLRELYLSFIAMNIVHAKALFQSCSLHVSEDFMADTLNRLIAHWGYEFFKEEGRYPYAFGGWISPKFSSVKLDLIYLPEDMNTRLIRAYKAVKKFSKIKSRAKSEKDFRPPIRKFVDDLSDLSSIDEEINNLPYHELYSKFGRPSNLPGLFQRFEKLRKLRLQEYKKKILFTSRGDFIKEFLIKNDGDYLIPRDLSYVALPVSHRDYEYSHRRWLSSPNPILSAVNYLKNQEIFEGVYPNILAIKYSKYFGFTNDFEISEAERSRRLFNTIGMPERLHCCMYSAEFTEEDLLRISRNYINIAAVYSAARFIGYFGIPVIDVIERPFCKEFWQILQGPKQCSEIRRWESHNLPFDVLHPLDFTITDDEIKFLKQRDPEPEPPAESDDEHEVEELGGFPSDFFANFWGYKTDPRTDYSNLTKELVTYISLDSRITRNNFANSSLNKGKNDEWKHLGPLTFLEKLAWIRSGGTVIQKEDGSYMNLRASNHESSDEENSEYNIWGERYDELES